MTRGMYPIAVLQLLPKFLTNNTWRNKAFGDYHLTSNRRIVNVDENVQWLMCPSTTETLMLNSTAATVMLNSTCTVLKWLPLKITSQLKQSLLSFNKRSENKRGKKIRELQNKQKRLFSSLLSFDDETLRQFPHRSIKPFTLSHSHALFSSIFHPLLQCLYVCLSTKSFPSFSFCIPLFS